MLYEVNLLIQYNENYTMHQFLIADIGIDNIILGYPFFEQFNPEVDWTKQVELKVALWEGDI